MPSPTLLLCRGKFNHDKLFCIKKNLKNNRPKKKTTKNTHTQKQEHTIPQSHNLHKNTNILGPPLFFNLLSQIVLK